MERQKISIKSVRKNTHLVLIDIKKRIVNAGIAFIDNKSTEINKKGFSQVGTDI